MSSEHDDERTDPDLGADEHTDPGIGPGEAYIPCAGLARRALASVEELERACPPTGAAGRLRHLEVLANAWGELGMLAHDTRRVTLALKREEEGKP